MRKSLTLITSVAIAACCYVAGCSGKRNSEPHHAAVSAAIKPLDAQTLEHTGKERRNADSSPPNASWDGGFSLVFRHQEGLEYQGRLEWRELLVLTNGTAFARNMTCPRNGQTGFQEQRCRQQLSAALLQYLRGAFEEHHFMTMTNPSRPEANRLSPDEAGYSITLRLASSAEHELNWAEGEDFIPGFYPLGDRLYGLYWRIVKTAPVYVGSFEPGWNAEGSHPQP